MEGNQTKMRETLLAVRDALDTISAHEDDVEFVRAWIGQTKDAVQEALAAPPRNCDVFKSESEMQAAFIDWYNEVFGLKGSKYAIDTCDLKHDVDGVLHDYIEWLLAPAEQKGGSNGSR